MLALVAIALRGTERINRAPASILNIDATPPQVTDAGTFRLVANGIAPESIVVDSVRPNTPSRLLFFQGRSVQPDYHGGGLAVDGAGGILRIDSDLAVTRLMANVDGRHIASVAAARESGLWLVTGDGEVARVDRDGNQASEFTLGPFIYSIVASDASGRAYLVRSPDQTGFRPVFGSTPLLARLNDDGTVEETIGGGFVPQDFLLTSPRKCRSDSGYGFHRVLCAVHSRSNRGAVY